MNESDAQKVHKMLEQTQQAVQQIALALSASTAVQLAAEFYPKDKRVELIEQFQGLQRTVQEAIAVHNACIESKGGFEATQASYAALRQAEGMQESFEQQHGLISALCSARSAFAKTSRT